MVHLMPAWPFGPMIIVNQLQGSVSIEKNGEFIDKNSFERLGGVTFVVYKRTMTDAAYGTSSDTEREAAFKSDKETGLYAKGTEAASTITTAANGTGSLKQLDAGTYWLYEKSVGSNSDYAANLAPIAFTVNIGETTALTGDKGSQEYGCQRKTEN